MPATAVAFAKVDLDPAASQKMAVRSLARRFPHPPATNLRGLLDSVLRDPLHGLGIEYDQDVKPWLGQRIGFALVVDAAGQPHPLFVLQANDSGRARTGLARVTTQTSGHLTFGFVVKDGYALISDTAQALAEAAAAPTKLTANAVYRGDLHSLTGSQVVLAWVDQAALLRQLVKTTNVDIGTATGRIAIGLHARDDGVELEALRFGGAEPSTTAPAPTLFTRLPASTVAAITLTGADRLLGQAFDKLDAVARAGGFEQSLHDMEQTLGLDPRRDILPLVGNELVLALGSVPAGDGLPELALVTQVGSIPPADKAAAHLRGLAARNRLSLRARRLGATLYLAFGPDYINRLLREDGIAQTAKFAAAVGTLDADTSFAAYADLAALTDPQRGTAGYPDIQPLDAVGIVAGHVAGHGFFRLRLILR